MSKRPSTLFKAYSQWGLWLFSPFLHHIGDWWLAYLVHRTCLRFSLSHCWSKLPVDFDNDAVYCEYHAIMNHFQYAEEKRKKNCTSKKVVLTVEVNCTSPASTIALCLSCRFWMMVSSISEPLLSTTDCCTASVSPSSRPLPVSRERDIR